MRAILCEQLSGKAAGTIVGRLEAAIVGTRLYADSLDRIDDAAAYLRRVRHTALALRERRGESLRYGMPEEGSSPRYAGPVPHLRGAVPVAYRDAGTEAKTPTRRSQD